MNFRAVTVAVGLLLFLNVSVWACDQPDCATAPRVKPLQIRQFMREQAASTRGVGLRPATKLISERRGAKAHPASKPFHSSAHVTTRYGYSRHSARGTVVKRTVHRSVASPAQLRVTETPVEAASFAAQEPLVDVVTAKRFDMVNRSAPASTAQFAPSARQVITEAFDVIDRNEVASISPRVADEPTKVDQDGHASILQRMWSTLRGAVATFSTADR